MAESLSCIKIDLTPVLPGAVNGGAKILVLELVRQFGRSAPNTKIILLTAEEAHAELGALERGNVCRRLITDDKGRFAQVRLWHDRAFRRLPWFVHRAIFALRNILPLSRHYEAPYPDLIFYPFGLSYPRRGFEPVPGVAVVYDLQHLAYPDFFKPQNFAERQRCLEFHKTHSAFITTSNFVRDCLIEQADVLPQSVVTIYIQPPALIPQVEGSATGQCLHRLRLEKQRYFVYPANFWRHKNHEMLLTAFALARANKLPSDFKLVCTGSPDKRMIELQDAAGALGLSDHVVFPGYLADTEFATLIRSSAGLVFPSLYEGYGMPVIEAMAAGCPVACSDRASLPEIAADAALLFDPRKPLAIADAICRLGTDEKLRSDLIAKGLRHAKQFSNVEQMAHEYWSAFEQIASKKLDGLFVTGVYPDGWAAPVFSLHLPEGASDRTLCLDLNVPDWLPIRSFKLTFVCQNPGNSYRATVQGGKQNLEVPVSGAAGRIDVQVRPFLRPCELPRRYASLDSRPLTIMVMKVELRDPTCGRYAVWPN